MPVRVRRVRGAQHLPLRRVQQLLQGEFAIHHRDDYAAMRGGQGAIHHQQIAVEDAHAAHRISCHAHEKGGLAMPDQVFIQADALPGIIIGGGGEACGYRRMQ